MHCSKTIRSTTWGAWTEAADETPGRAGAGAELTAPWAMPRMCARHRGEQRPQRQGPEDGADGYRAVGPGGPRDRNGSFMPQLVPKRQRRLEGFDAKVLSLYARGLSTREIQGHLEELYGTEVSPTLISTITDAVLEDGAPGRPGRSPLCIRFCTLMPCRQIAPGGASADQSGVPRAWRYHGRREGTLGVVAE